MANEITITSSIRVANGQLNLTTPSASKQFNQTTARAGTFTVDVGTSEETLSFGDIVPGFVELTNLDTTNFVEVGFATGVYPLKLRATSGKLMLDLNGSPTIYVKADTAACAVQVTAVNV